MEHPNQNIVIAPDDLKLAVDIAAEADASLSDVLGLAVALGLDCLRDRPRSTLRVSALARH